MWSRGDDRSEEFKGCNLKHKLGGQNDKGGRFIVVEIVEPEIILFLYPFIT